MDHLFSFKNQIFPFNFGIGEHMDRSQLTKLEKGQKVKVAGNEIFKIMGYIEVTGTVFNINHTQGSFSISCKETGAIELVSLEDGGEVTIL